MRTRTLLALISILAVRVAVVLLVGRPWDGLQWHRWVTPESDTISYLELSGDLADLQVDQPSFRTPGYPLFLLATGSTTDPSAATIVAQQFVSLAAALLLWGAAARLGLRGGGMAAIYYLMLPSDMVASSRILPDNLLAGAAALAGYLLVRGLTTRGSRECLAMGYLSGFAASFASIVKPVAIFAPIAVFAPLLLFRGRARRSARIGATLLMLAASVSLPTLWRSANHLRFGLDAISTQQAFEPMGRVVILSGRVSRSEFRTTFADSLEGLFTRPDGTVDWSGRDRLFRSLMMTELRKAPARVILPHLLSWPRILSSNVGTYLHYWGLFDPPTGALTLLAKALIILYNALPFAGMAVAALTGRRKRPAVRTALMLGLLMWGYTSVMLGPLGASGTRYWMLALWAVTLAGAAGLELAGGTHREES